MTVLYRGKARAAWVAAVIFVAALSLSAVLFTRDDEPVFASGCLLSYSWCFSSGNDDQPGLDLPKPVYTPGTANSLNSYGPRLSSGSKANFVVVIRTYRGFLNATRELLENLDVQHNLAENGIAVHAVLLPTDINSTSVIRAEVEKGIYRSSLFRNVKVHFHAFSSSVYEDNCCQLTQMCTAKAYEAAWVSHLQKRFGQYKPESRAAKVQQMCSKGNNLLHYVLCDAAMRYVVAAVTAPLAPVNSSSSSSYLLFTNGDNVYSRDFVWKMVRVLEASASSGGRNVLDVAMCDYLERGVGLVHSTLRINQMDLGGTVYRASGLARLGIGGFLDAMPRQAWPTHYYAADGEFARFLVKAKGARWGRVPEVLFTHW